MAKLPVTLALLCCLAAAVHAAAVGEDNPEAISLSNSLGQSVGSLDQVQKSVETILPWAVSHRIIREPGKGQNNKDKKAKKSPKRWKKNLKNKKKNKKSAKRKRKNLKKNKSQKRKNLKKNKNKKTSKRARKNSKKNKNKKSAKGKRKNLKRKKDKSKKSGKRKGKGNRKVKKTGKQKGKKRRPKKKGGNGAKRKSRKNGRSSKRGKLKKKGSKKDKRIKKLNKGKKKRGNQKSKNKSGRGAGKKTQRKKKPSPITGRDNTNLAQNIRRYIKFVNAQRQTKNIERKLNNVGKKKGKSSEAFKGPLQSLAWSTNQGKSCRGNSSALSAANALYETLKKCATTASEACSYNLTAADQKVLDDCKTPQADYISAFEACIKVGEANTATCIGGLNFTNTDCDRNFVDIQTAAVEENKKCIGQSATGSFGNCKQAAGQVSEYNENCLKTVCDVSNTTNATTSSSNNATSTLKPSNATSPTSPTADGGSNATPTAVSTVSGQTTKSISSSSAGSTLPEISTTLQVSTARSNQRQYQLRKNFDI